MMFLLGIVVLQTPPTAPTVVHRIWKANQKDKYQVEIDFKDAGGSSSSAFTLELQGSKLAPVEGDMTVQASFMDQTLKFGSLKNTHKGLFGTATLTMASTGLPGGLVGKGSTAPYMAPFLAWYLPDAVDSAGKFTLAGAKTDDGVTVDGSGTASFEKSGDWKVVSQFSFSEKSVPMGSLGTTAWFDKKNGKLLRAQGQFKAKDGSAEFSVK